MPLVIAPWRARSSNVITSTLRYATGNERCANAKILQRSVDCQALLTPCKEGLCSQDNLVIKTFAPHCDGKRVTRYILFHASPVFSIRPVCSPLTGQQRLLPRAAPRFGYLQSRRSHCDLAHGSSAASKHPTRGGPTR